MRILFLAGTLGRGGAEKQLFYLSRLLHQNGYHIKVACLTKNEFYEAEIKNLGIEVVFIGKSTNKLVRLLEFFKIATKFKPNFIYGFHFYTGFYAGIVARLLGIKGIGSIRSNGHAEKKFSGSLAFIHFIFPHFLIANSINGLNNSKKIFYNKKIEYLPNIIDFNRFTFKNKKEINSINLLFIGSLKQVKNPEHFVEIVRVLTQEKQNIKAKIIGSGVLENSLKLNSKNLNIGFYRAIDDVSSFLYEANYLISTSKTEGTPNVILEAMATGTPVLAIYHEGLIDWVNNGLLIKTDTIEDIINQIKNRTINDIEKSREFLHSNHTESVVLEKFKQITK